jgi:hypothetical protein
MGRYTHGASLKWCRGNWAEEAMNQVSAVQDSMSGMRSLVCAQEPAYKN